MVYLAEAAVILGLYALVAGVVTGEAFGVLILLVLGVVAMFLFALVMVTFVLFPAILIGELTARRTFWPAAPLVALALLLLLTFAGSAAWASLTGTPLRDAWFVGLIALAVSILPAITFGLATYPTGWILSRVLGRFPRLTSFLRRSFHSFVRRFPRLATRLRIPPAPPTSPAFPASPHTAPPASVPARATPASLPALGTPGAAAGPHGNPALFAAGTPASTAAPANPAAATPAAAANAVLASGLPSGADGAGSAGLTTAAHGTAAKRPGGPYAARETGTPIIRPAAPQSDDASLY